MRLDFLRARRLKFTRLSISRGGATAARRAASNIQDFTDGVSHACHTSRYTGSQPSSLLEFRRFSHLADLATAGERGTTLLVFRLSPCSACRDTRIEFVKEAVFHLRGFLFSPVNALPQLLYSATRDRARRMRQLSTRRRFTGFR